MAASVQDKSDHSKYVYFQPGEIIFVVTHVDASLGREDLDALIAWSDKKAGEHGLTVLARTDNEELLSFPASLPNDQEQESILKAQVEPLPDSHYRAPRVELFEEHGPFSIVLADVKDKGDFAKYVDSSRLARFVTQLDNSIQSTENPDQPSFPTAGTILEVVSPNWLSSPCSEYGGGGGPGSRPVSFPGNNPPTKTQYEFHLPDEVEKYCQPIEDRGIDVVVAILDTAPCLHDLVAAYEKWQKVDPEPNIEEGYPGNPPGPHGLIETLLKPNGPLTLYPATSEELLRMRSVHLKDHNYEMADHGLFVAGIIHSIAPAAKIHLYEVLNPEGVGDLKSIASGLGKVLKEIEEHPAQQYVINCSLVLNIPLLDQPITDLDIEFKAKIIREWDKHKDKAESINRLSEELWNEPEGKQWLARQAKAIERICNLIYKKNSRVIAAAGNDRIPGTPRSERPQARFPAAFESVAGVGALKKRFHKNDLYDSAEYSDLSDKPKEVGITTLGGEKGANNGVLGVYIGQFPRLDDHKVDEDHPVPKNGCDWAWWAGTSFASPIIAGITAALLSGNPGAATEQAIKFLYDSQAIITTPPENEDALNVTQGPMLS